MKMLSINTGWQTQRLIILDHARADAAYSALKEAIDTYDRFGNDKSKSVSIGEDFGEATFKIEHLVSVAIEELGEAADAIFVQCEERNARLNAIVKKQSPIVTVPLKNQTGEAPTAEPSA